MMTSVTKRLIYTGIILIAFSSLTAQTAKFIPLNLDYAIFNTKTDKEYVEIYLSFLQRTLQYVKSDSGFIANFSIQLEISDDNGVVYERNEPFISTVNNPSEIFAHQELRHLFACQLQEGDYSVKVGILDSNSGARGEYFQDLPVRGTPDGELAMSEIQLAVKITPAEGMSKFNKNGLEVIPNPSGVYHISLPMLYYYAEVYNLAFAAVNPGTYTVESFITDKEDHVVRTFPEKTNQKPGSSAVLVGGNNVVTLASATHFLHLKITDNSTGESIEKVKRFSLFKPSSQQIAQVRATTSNLMAAYYSKFDGEQLDDEFAKSSYIATKEEKEMYKDLGTKEAKIKFLIDFWKDRDSDRATPRNEYKIKYFQRVEYASRNFRTKFKEGWKTDRGRVLLMYGSPNEIERSPSQSGTKPYEIWTYNELDGGSIFVFADLRGFGEYELLHSTYRRELNQPDWERLIRVQKGRSDGFDFR